MINKEVKITLYIATFMVGMGFVLGKLFNGSLEEPGYWFLIFVWFFFTRNIFAYLQGWTMHFGVGGYLTIKDHSQERLIGFVVSIIVVLIASIQWVRLFFL